MTLVGGDALADEPGGASGLRPSTKGIFERNSKTITEHSNVIVVDIKSHMHNAETAKLLFSTLYPNF